MLWRSYLLDGVGVEQEAGDWDFLVPHHVLVHLFERDGLFRLFVLVHRQNLLRNLFQPARHQTQLPAPLRLLQRPLPHPAQLRSGHAPLPERHLECHVASLVTNVLNLAGISSLRLSIGKLPFSTL